jgi:hypothetical protein
MESRKNYKSIIIGTIIVLIWIFIFGIIYYWDYTEFKNNHCDLCPIDPTLEQCHYSICNQPYDFNL